MYGLQVRVSILPALGAWDLNSPETLLIILYVCIVLSMPPAIISSHKSHLESTRTHSSYFLRITFYSSTIHNLYPNYSVQIYRYLPRGFSFKSTLSRESVQNGTISHTTDFTKQRDLWHHGSGASCNIYIYI